MMNLIEQSFGNGTVSLGSDLGLRDITRAAIDHVIDYMQALTTACRS